MQSNTTIDWNTFGPEKTTYHFAIIKNGHADM